MNTGLDISSTLHELVQRAMASLPGAQRGSLLVCAGRRLVYRATVGLDDILPGRVRMPSDGGRLSASAPFGPAAAPEAARGPCLVPAAAWYGAHLPELAERPGWPPEGAAMQVVPVHMFGAPGAYLALEQPDATPLPGASRALLSSVVEGVGAALARRGLFDEKAQVAQEIRLLEEVLNAVAESVDVVGLIETLADGIRSAQTGPQWAAIDLALLDDARSGPRAPDAAPPVRRRTARIHRAPRRPLTSYWNNVHEGAMVAGRDLRAEVQFELGRADGPMSQERLIEEGIRRGVRGIAVAPIDSAALEPSIRRAADAGIPVVAIDTPPVEGTRAALYIGTDNRAAGRLAGELMLRLLPQGGAVAAQCVSTTVRNVRERLEGFREAVAGTSIRLEPPSESQFEQARALELARDSLESRPDIVGAFGVCSENGPSFGVASMELGRGGDLKIVAFDLITSTLAMLRDGVIHAAIVQREHEMAYRAVQVLYDIATRGAEATLAELPASRVVHTGVDVVTVERSPCSMSVADHLAQSSAHRIGGRRLGEAHERPLEFLVMGIAETARLSDDEELPVEEASVVGQVIRSSSSLVIDIDAGSSEHQRFPEVAAARGKGARTLVGVPLISGDAVIGVLLLSSARVDACSASDLALLERVAAVASIVLENARLLSRLKERTRELESLSRRQEALFATIAELSSPVVPIAPGVLVMPIVGALDAQRSGRFIESMLREIAAQKARVVIVDVTGMAAVDASAASHLAQAARAAALLGTEVVLVGIAPEAARLMVDQGLDLGDIVTRATLELGFSYALRKTGGRVVYRT
ncbi:substrate-binding domain-containing protein [Sorangium sp. So ce1151]|uniref:substrate-binding domain-containing protein n=1 Tax=Sorangium sp. So ce1151 TaxID=3133332 RepID=UPI003F5F71E7